MKNVILALSILICSTSFKLVGSGTAVLTCKSESGRTTFTAGLQDITGLLEEAVLTVDGNTVPFTSDDEVFTIFDPKNRVLTISISGKPSKEFPNGKFIQFWAVPSTFKIIKSERDHQTYEFKGKIEGTEPRKNKDLRIPQVELTCKLEYKI